MNKLKISGIIFFLLATISVIAVPKKGVKNELQETTETVTDIDGNIYKTVKIGTRVWMVENLKVTHFRNGDPIKYTFEDISYKPIAAYCDYENNPTNSNKYGRLYNFLAVSSKRNLAPLGWHIPTEEDWNSITTNMDFIKDKLKKKFVGLAAGAWLDRGSFVNKGKNGYWWCISPDQNGFPWVIKLHYSDSDSDGYDYHDDVSCLSVRCVKDK